MARKAKQPKGKPSVPEAVKPAYDAIVALTEPIARSHANADIDLQANPDRSSGQQAEAD
jgi:hypothetical protein